MAPERSISKLLNFFLAISNSSCVRVAEERRTSLSLPLLEVQQVYLGLDILGNEFIFFKSIITT